MGAGAGFAEVLFSKLADAPPPVACGRRSEPRIASPPWVHRLEPLRVVTAQVLHSRYPQTASAAPAAGGIPMEAGPKPLRGGSRMRSPRERLAIQMLNRLGASLTLTASNEDIRGAYRQLVRESHPDRQHGVDAHTINRQAQRLRAVVGAWHAFQGRSSHH
jgi:hypothetical protein